MKMKKLLSLLTVSALVVGLMGCASSDTSTSSEPADTKEEAAESTDDTEEAKDTAGAVDYKNFTIDPSQIPQEKLDTTVYLAVSVRGLENPYIATINEGMKMFAAYLDSIGQKYETQVLDSQGDSVVEVDNMRQFAAKANGNAIAYADPNEDSIAYSLAEAMAESGGYLGTAWNKPADVSPEDLTPNWVIHTAPDNVNNGYQIAKALFEQMGGSGKIFAIQGLLGNTSNTDRYAGLQKALEEYPDIEVVEIQYDNDSVEQALTYTEGFLQKYPDLKGIFCNNMSNPIGAAQAVVDAGKDGDITLVGMDHDLRALEYLRDGTISALGVQDCYKMGFDTIQVAIMIADGLEPGDDTYPEQTEEQTTIVYPEDAQAMIDKLYPDSK